ncbi:MAG: sensor histidine kinase [Ktedonobacteraceae bacterium]
MELDFCYTVINEMLCYQYMDAMNRTNTSLHTSTLTGKQLCQQRGWTWILAPKPFDVVSSSLYIGVVLTDFYVSCDCEFIGTRFLLIIGAILILLSIDRLEYWFYGEEIPVVPAITLLIARIVLIECVAQLDNFNISPFLYLIPPFLATLYFGNRAGYLLASFAWIVYQIKLWIHEPYWYNDGRVVNNLIIFTLGLIFAITIARTVTKEKESRVRAEHLLTELEISHQQLKSYSEQVAELATTKERNRLARDIHDTLGHYLTVINVQLEKALAFRNLNPQEAEQAVSDAKRLASEALQDVRISVGALRATEEAFTFSTAINTLVARVRSNALSIAVDIRGNDAEFSKQALITLYRAAQEGLTNVQKHAQASSVCISIHFMESEACLSLSDNGCGFDVSLLYGRQPGYNEHFGQYGLQGIQERLETVGGQMQMDSHPGEGTHLLVVVPRDMLANPVTLARTNFASPPEDRKNYGRK